MEPLLCDTVLGAEDTIQQKKTKISDLMTFPLWEWTLKKVDISYMSKIDRASYGDKKKLHRRNTTQVLSNSGGHMRQEDTVKLRES